VYGVYIKWQYTWFVIHSCFFLNSPSELTFWIAYVCWLSNHTPSDRILVQWKVIQK